MNCKPKLMIALCFASMVTGCAPSIAQSACPFGYRILAHHYDAELRKTFELRQDCAHPTWPAHSFAINSTDPLFSGNAVSPSLTTLSNVQPVLVHAGEGVRLWSQDASSRIEITGIAEQSARLGEHINIRITHQSDDSGLTIQHIAGIVRAVANVEIAQ